MWAFIIFSTSALSDVISVWGWEGIINKKRRALSSTERAILQHKEHLWYRSTCNVVFLCSATLVYPMDRIYIKTPNPKGWLFEKNLPVKVLGGRCFSVWGPRSPPVTHCMNTYHCTYSHREGGGGVRWTSEKVRGALLHKRGWKYQHDWLYLQSINSIKTPVKTTFRVWCLYCYLVHALSCGGIF